MKSSIKYHGSDQYQVNRWVTEAICSKWKEKYISDKHHSSPAPEFVSIGPW